MRKRAQAFGMSNDTNSLLEMAARFRAHARETSLDDYRAVMLRTALELEAIAACGLDAVPDTHEIIPLPLA